MGCVDSKKLDKNNLEVVSKVLLVPWEDKSQLDPRPKKQETDYAEISAPDDKDQDQVTKWDSDHVKLPHSPECFIMGVMRWTIVKRGFAKPIRNIRDIEAVIESYNLNVSFGALRSLLRTRNYARNFFDETLPAIINLALELPRIIRHPIPLLKKGRNDKISLTQLQVACLLANGFLCTFPKQNVEMSQNSKVLSINFTRLFGIDEAMVVEKLKCVVNYLKRVSNGGCYENVLTFQRKSIKEPPEWDKLHDTAIDYSSIQVVNGKIEDAENMLHVDFANKSIGGGVLGRGCVQEEIRFMMSPEMIVAKLFTESLDDNEALEMIGCERFNSYRGYSSSFQWAGNYEDKTAPHSRRVVAIDALEYHDNQAQFKVKNILRDLNKAYVGFHTEEERPTTVASGLWGCGAFNGDPIRSVLIQVMACAINNRGLRLHILNNQRMEQEVKGILNILEEHKVSIGGIYQLLLSYFNEGSSRYSCDLVRHISETLSKAAESLMLVNVDIVCSEKRKRSKRKNNKRQCLRSSKKRCLQLYRNLK